MYHICKQKGPKYCIMLSMEKHIETKLYIAKISELKNENAYESAYASVDAERQKKVDSYKFLQSKLQSLAAGVLLNRALEDAGLDVSKIQFEQNAYGKPYIQGLDIYFNLSHSGDYAICAISNAEVGCDIEKIDRDEEKIAKRFFCDEEYRDIISKKSEEERKTIFYRYWTLKESFMKATGMGLKLHLNSFQIIISNKISIKQSVNNSEYSFYEIDEIDGYKCSICVQGANANLNIQTISLL